MSRIASCVRRRGHRLVRSVPFAILMWYLWTGWVRYVRFESVKKGEEITITHPLIGFHHTVSGLWSKAKDLPMTFDWLGNMAIRADPPGRIFPLFTGKPRQVPPPPVLGSSLLPIGPGCLSACRSLSEFNNDRYKRSKLGSG